jgi:uncharacterized protein (DUF58 family)
MNAPAVGPLPADSAAARRDGLAAAHSFRLPFASRSWRGLQGNWLGSGLGSSIDFQDHRAYLPGDDPRHIHWAAYARTGLLTMKLFRAEVAPMVEIAVDVSASMTYDPAKATRMESLLAFCVESAVRTGAPVRIFAVNGRTVRPLTTDEVRAGRWRERALPGPAEPAPAGPAGGRSPIPPPVPPGPLPWRGPALKVLISDLLFPGDPSGVLVPLAAGAGTALVLAPALASEAVAPAPGNLELIDCESLRHRHRRVEESFTARYREAYGRHFNLWREAARRRGVRLACTPCAGTLADALALEALPAGAVEHNL